ncbi:MAG: hypothetical protein WCA77_02400 [Thermoplasmata archaeon]
MPTEDALAAQLAHVMLRDQLRLKRGENVIIETWTHTLSFAAACVVEARRLGAHPMLLLEEEAAFFRSVQAAPSVGTWGRVGTHEWAALSKSHAYVFFPGPADRSRFDSLSPAQRQALEASEPEWFRRADRARLRGIRSVLGYASESAAERYGISLSTWRTQLVEASVNADMAQIGKDAQRATRLLKTGKTLRVTAPNGTDFQVRLRGRAPVADDGVVGPDDLKAHRNITWAPPGSVAVAIDERSAEGMAIANRPSFPNPGRLEGGQWEMHAGHLGSYWYTDGQTTFDSEYHKAGRGKDIVSYFSIGLNPAQSPGLARVEDQEAGAVTLGVGGNTTYGGSNRCDFLSYIVMGEATVAVDGLPLVDRGKLL